MVSLYNKDFIIYDKDYLKRESVLGAPSDRDFNEKMDVGAVILDKPSKVTSQDLVVHIKRMLNLRKVAHVGTLDPGVSGVLPILFNRSVKFNHYLSKGDKEYVVLMNIHKEVPQDKIVETLKSFEGEIIQIPPKKSAVKRVPRKRRVYRIEILEIDSNRYVLFKARVQAGTYMRVLCHDFGKKVKVGAHMQELRRIESMRYNEEEAVSFYEFLERAYLYSKFNKYDYLEEILTPIEDIILRNFKILYVKDEAASSIVYGAPLYRGGLVIGEKNILKGDIIAIFTMKGKFVGLMRSLVDFSPNFTSRKIAISESLLITPKEMPKLWNKK